MCCLGAYYRFIFLGRTYGYRALASRTNELLGLGASQVWLLYGAEGVGYNTSLRYTSNWTLLNTGFLAYMSGGKLVIEYPWWNKMQPLLASPIAQLNPTASRVIYRRKAYPAVQIGGRSYVVMAMNINDIAVMKRLLNFKDYTDGNALLDSFTHSLSAVPSSADHTTSEAVDDAPPAPRLGWLQIIRGTFLYLLLPCLVLTAVVVLIAMIAL